MRYLDTNIIIRYLTRDDETKAAACYQLFERVSNGSEELTTSVATIVEATYVLSSRRGPVPAAAGRSRCEAPSHRVATRSGDV